LLGITFQQFPNDLALEEDVSLGIKYGIRKVLKRGRHVIHCLLKRLCMADDLACVIPDLTIFANSLS
jgi:hypothetical protein